MRHPPRSSRASDNEACDLALWIDQWPLGGSATRLHPRYLDKLSRRTENASSNAIPKSLHMQKNEVRIIGGAWRSRRIRFAPTAGLRPTPDRVRETLFNWLGQIPRWLAVLRLVRRQRRARIRGGLARGGFCRHGRTRCGRAACPARQRATVAGPAQTQLVIAAGDSLEYVRTTTARFDVVFLDPPFASDLTAAALELLPPRLNSGARVYAEGARASDEPAGWTQLKHARAGQVHFALLSRD